VGEKDIVRRFLMGPLSAPRRYLSMHIPAFVLPISPGCWRNVRNGRTLIALKNPCGADVYEPENDLPAANAED
jgi:hypothetical protein